MVAAALKKHQDKLLIKNLKIRLRTCLESF